MTDKKVVKLFVEHLAREGRSGFEIERFPDCENLDSRDIDAIAGEYAIEHTSIDTLPD